MFVLLLVVSRVAGEWVEITQHQHQQVPSRRHTFSYDGTTKTNKIYTNYSLTELPRHRSDVQRVPNFGSVKRVQLQSKQKDKINPIGFITEITTEKQNDEKRYENMSPVRASNIKIKENIVTRYMEKKSNVGDETNSSYLDKRNSTKGKLDNPSRHSSFANEKIFNAFKENNKIIENNKFQTIITLNQVAKTKYNPFKINQNTKSIANDSNTNINNEMQLSKETRINVKSIIQENGNKVERIPNSKIRNMSASLDATNNFLPKNQSPALQHAYIEKSDIKDIVKENCTEDPNKQIKAENITFRVHQTKEKVKDKLENYRDHNDFHDENVYLGDNSKPNTVEVIWQLMKKVTDHISKNTRRNFKSKIKYLEDLRNNILENIAQRIEEAWPEDTQVRPDTLMGRQRRAARGHVEFPSSESALMTISFLTFAVFLIKLVLQVIHTYKNKTMMVTPAVVAAVGRAFAAIKEQTHH